MTTKKQAREQARADAIRDLRAMLDPLIVSRAEPGYHGDTVDGPCILLKLDHVSRSGMARDITPMVIVGVDRGEPDMRYLGRLASIVLGSRCEDQSVRVVGCGMDMGFHLVSSLSRALYHGVHPRPDYVLRSRWL